MNTQDVLTPSLIGSTDIDQFVESAGPQQRGVDQVWAVGGADQHHRLQVFHPIEFGQDGVDDARGHLRLAARSARGDQAVDLVDEHHARRHLPRAGEQPGDLLLAFAIPFAEQVRRLDRDEVGLGLFRDRLGQQRLARARRAIEQEALGGSNAEPMERLGILDRKFDAFAQAFLRRAEPADIGPAHFGRFDHHFAHRARLDAFQRRDEIVAADSQRIEHFGRDRLLVEIELGHDPSHRFDRRLSRQSGKVRTDEAMRGARQFAQVDALTQRHAAGVDAQDLAASAFVGNADHDLAVKPAGPA